jgi:hypothetical protein
MQIENMFLNNIVEIKKTMNKNKNHDVKLIDSAFYDFDLESLIESALFYKYHEDLTDHDYNIIKNILFSYDSINDYLYENLKENNNIKFLSDIKENMLISYIENKSWFKKEYLKIQKEQESLSEEDQDIDLSWFIVFNINNHELNISDSDNINRYGSPEEVLSFLI